MWPSDSSTPARTVGKWIFLLLACAYFACCYAAHKSFLDLPLYTRGGGPLPYQYRVLPMYIFRVLLRIPLTGKIASHIAPIGRDPYTLVFLLIAFSSVFGAVLATMATIRRLTGNRIFAFWASLLLLVMCQIDLASSWYYNFITPYDIPSIFFFACGISLILARRWWLYYPVFLLAVLNRETACFITVFFAVYEFVRLEELGKDMRTRLLSIVPPTLLQAAAWVAIKIFLVHVYGHNPSEFAAHTGGMFAIKLGYNLKELLKPMQWPVLLSLCGFSLPFLWVQRRWIQNRAYASACAVVLALSGAGLMIVGVIVETRIFADWIALVTPTLALILWNKLRPVETAA